MSQLTEQQGEVVQSAIKGISQIATLPEITVKIIELVEDPGSTAQDLHQLIAHDPALCSRILKVVNSAFYGLPRQIGSINRAIVLLGLNAVKNIAIAASLSKLFKGGNICPGFEARDLWVHSIATGACSKLLSDQLKFGLPDEAFLAGLIHDIGIIVEMQSHQDGLTKVIAQLAPDENGVPTRDMRELEAQIMGADHCAFGAGLCEAWKFPKSFAYVTAHHHDPMKLPDGSRLLTSIVYVADRLTAEAGFGFRGDLMHIGIDASVAGELGLGDQELSQARDNLPKIYDEVSATFR